MKRFYDYKGLLTLRKKYNDFSIGKSIIKKDVLIKIDGNTFKSARCEVMEYLLGDESPLFKELEREKVI